MYFRGSPAEDDTSLRLTNSLSVPLMGLGHSQKGAHLLVLLHYEVSILKNTSVASNEVISHSFAFFLSISVESSPSAHDAPQHHRWLETIYWLLTIISY